MENTIIFRVKKCIVERLNLRVDPAAVGDDALLFASEEGAEEDFEQNLGLDSIDALELIVALGDEFNVKIEDEDMHVLQSIRTIADYVESKIDKK